MCSVHFLKLCLLPLLVTLLEKFRISILAGENFYFKLPIQISAALFEKLEENTFLILMNLIKYLISTTQKICKIQMVIQLIVITFLIKMNKMILYLLNHQKSHTTILELKIDLGEYKRTLSEKIRLVIIIMSNSPANLQK